MDKKSTNILFEQNEVKFVHIKSSGPGGQNINKVSTGIQLYFDINSSSLNENVKMRLIQICGKRVSRDGILIIEAKKFRTQEKNKQDALKRLSDLIQEAVKLKKKRKKTYPSKSAIEARLEKKQRRSQTKQLRKKFVN